MIIGLTGLKGSGKDTVAAYLIKQHGFERRAFADKGKKSVAATLQIPYHLIDAWKNDPSIYVSVVKYYETGGPETLYTQSFRDYLKHDMTEGHRDVYGEDFYIDYCLPLGHYYVNKKIVMTDARFDNEAKRVRYLDGHIVYIDRPGLDTQDQHRSEAGISAKYIDYSIINDGTISDLEERIELMLDFLLNPDYRIKRVLGG